jgi:FtsX-like permease family
VAGAVAISPLAPVGPVRAYDPVRGVQADGLVLGAGAVALLVLLLAELAWMAWRSVRQSREIAAAPVSALVAAASRTGLPVTVVTGIRHALDRGTGRLRAPVRATILGSVAAVTALVAALVFGASLTGLTTHPARYGWNWTVLVQSAGGWGSWPYGPGDPLLKPMRNQPGLTGWSELGFGQVDIDNVEVPAMGLETHPGQLTVEPPTTSGHPLAACNQANDLPGCDQVELGTVTMRQLGLHVGDRIHVGSDPRLLTLVGAVTMPSIGVNLTDHPSLGRGVLLAESTMLRALGDPLAPSQQEMSNAAAAVAYPATVVLDAKSAALATAIGKRVIAALDAEPDSTGDAYALPPELGAPVRNSSQLGGQPLALAVGVAAAAVLALALTILASVRHRRRDLALLKALGLRSRQIRRVVGWQTSTILLIAIAAGVPLGIAAGNWLWTSFANSLGVVPLPVVPAAELVAGVAALLVAGNLLALWPAHLAARIAPAATFRTE